MKTYILLLSLVISYKSISAQQSVYIGIFGEGTAFSINYETMFFEIGSFNLLGKFGLGVPNIGTSILKKSTTLNDGFSLPHYITGSVGRRRHQFEAGLGGVILSTKSDRCYQFLPIIGYRFRPFDTGILFRAFVHPKAVGRDECSLISPFGISFGYQF
jgi:hypothetical protein